MRCDQIEKLLYLYEDGELDEKEKREVGEHIKICPNCSKKLADLKLIRAEVKEKKVPQPSETYWESFAHRVKERIEDKTKVSFGQRFSYFLEMIFSYSPTKVKWAAAVVSVILVFVVVKLFVSYEKINIATLGQKAQVQKISPPAGETLGVETNIPREQRKPAIAERGGVAPEREVSKTIQAPLKDMTVSKGLESVAPGEERGVQKETPIADRIAPDKGETTLKKLPTTTPELKEKEERHTGVQALETPISGTPVMTSAESSKSKATMAAVRGDTVKQEELVRESIDKWRRFIEDKPKGEEKDKAYLNMAQGYMRLYDLARNKDETLKEAMDSVKVYKDSAVTNTYKDSINHILIQLESFHKN
ncbi:MAG TPA: zf-HC2 domain-containing protein [candidate division Zixibacteria bacterium]